MKGNYCFAKLKENKIKFQSKHSTIHSITKLIENDKENEIFKPCNKKYFTFKILDVDGQEITKRQLTKAIKLAFLSWSVRINIEVKKARKGQYADFKIKFSNPTKDKYLDADTIMYHYYPIDDFDDPLRGLCVINSLFHYTSHGNDIPRYLVEPKHSDTFEMSYF